MFTHLSNLLWLWILPAILALLVIQSIRNSRRLNAITGANARRVLASRRIPGVGFLRWCAILLGLALVILALSGPAWDPISETVQRQGRDVVFLVDVSKSMLAEDLRPNRLERAKADIQDCVEALSGDRVALVAFAGTSAILCPLTQDYGFFRMMLSELSIDAVTRGGTNLGDALRTVQRSVFDDQQRLGRDIILITDGEDHDSMPVEAAKAIGTDDVRLIAIGIGDDKNGTLLSLPDQNGHKQVLRYQGEPVRSKLDSETLRAMTSVTPGGIYLPVATNAFDLRETYLRLVNAAEKHQMETETIEHLQPKYQLFLLPAMLLFALAIFLPAGRAPHAIRLAVLCLLFCAGLHAGEFQEGNKAYRSGDYVGAIAHYQQCREGLKNKTIPPNLDFNLGLAQYAAKQYTEAETSIRSAIENNGLSEKPNDELDAKARMCLANTLVNMAEEACDQVEQTQNPEPLQHAKKAVEEAIQNYKANTEKDYETLVQKNLPVAEELQKRIEELLKKFQQEQQDQQNQQGQQEQRQAQVTQAEKGSEEEKESEALPAELQQIIDGEKQRRINQRMKTSRQNPVEKDW